MNKLLDSAVFLALGTAVLYCVSTANYRGFLDVFLLDSDVLDRNFHQVLYNGVVICLAPLLYAFLGVFLYRFLYSHAFLPALTDFFKGKFTRKRKLIKFRRFWVGKRKDSLAIREAKSKTRQAGVLLASGLVFLLSLAYFQLIGKSKAQMYAEAIKSGKAKLSNLVSVKIEGKEKSLFYLGCGARNCAGIEKDTKAVYYFPQDGHSYKFAK